MMPKVIAYYTIGSVYAELIGKLKASCEKFGFRSSFEVNGEFYILFRDWSKLQPLFKYIKNATSLEEAKECLNDEGNKEYNVELLYNEFKKAL